MYPRIPLRLGGGADLRLVIQRQRQPAHVLRGDPLIQPQPPEIPFRRLALPGRPGLRPELTRPHGHAIGGVAGFPQRLVIDIQGRDPVRVIPGQHRDAIHHRQPFRVVHVQRALRLSPAPRQNPPAFLVDFPTDRGAVRVIARRSQYEHGLLPAGGIRAGGQHVPPIPARTAAPGVQLITEDGGKGRPVLVVNVAGVDLHHPAEPGADLPHAVPAPG